MTVDRIISVEINGEGRLCVRPATQAFPLVYRAAMEVSWDPERGCLLSPQPRTLTYADWFRRILSAAQDEYGLRLRLTPETKWANVPDETRREMEAAV